MKRNLVLATAFILLATELTVRADPGRIAIAGRTGTLGLGGDLIVNVLEDLNLRFGVGAFNVDYDSDWSDVEYDVDLDVLTFPMTLDWYPFDDKLHISAGVVLNETDADLDSTYSGSVEINGVTYTASQVGVLSGDFGFDNVAPYIGIGWGNAFGKSRRWGFITDLGVAFIGSPDVKLSATGTLASDPTFQANLAQEESDLQDDLDGFKFYPVLSANLYFRF